MGEAFEDVLELFFLIAEDFCGADGFVGFFWFFCNDVDVVCCVFWALREDYRDLVD